MDDREQAPQFPIRIIFDDGACEFIDTPDQLYSKLDSIDSTDPENRIWVRDDQDRNVKIRMQKGELQMLKLDVEARDSRLETRG